MREILFRGKSTDSGEWVEGWLKPFINAGYIGANDRLCIQNGMFSKDIYEVIPETVGQYTGLTDKNGKKIFEGDIVKHYYNDKFDIGKIFFCEESCTFLRTCGSNIRYDENYCIIMASCVYEVIGNIYDNPELRVRQYGTDEE